MYERTNEYEEMRKRAEEKLFKGHERSLEIYKLAEQIADYVSLDEEGNVFIEAETTGKNKVALVAAARYVGSKLRENIKDEVTLDELAKYTLIDKTVVKARVSELVREGFLLRVRKGVYKIRSFSKIKELLKELSGEKSEKSKEG